MTELESDVVVEVGEMSFYLHKVSAGVLFFVFFKKKISAGVLLAALFHISMMLACSELGFNWARSSLC
jgi:hypothetical protein